MAVLIVCGVDKTGHRDIIAVEPMTKESRSSYSVLFQERKERGLTMPKRIMLQGTFHVQYLGLCTSKREESLCSCTEGNQVGTYCTTG